MKIVTKNFFHFEFFISGPSINIIRQYSYWYKTCSKEINLAKDKIIIAIHKRKYKRYVNNNEKILNELNELYHSFNKNLISIC